jgi:hypothetical protein
MRALTGRRGHIDRQIQEPAGHPNQLEWEPVNEKLRTVLLAHASELNGVSLGDGCAQRSQSVQVNALFRCGEEKFIEDQQLILTRFEFREQSLDLLPIRAIDQVDRCRLPSERDLGRSLNLPQIDERRFWGLDAVVWQRKIPERKEVSAGQVALISPVKL